MANQRAAFARQAFWAVPGTAFTTLTFLASVRLSDAETILAGNLKALGIDPPSYLETVAANWFVFLVGIVGLFVTIWLFSRTQKQPDFEDVNAWSVSVDLGCMAASHEDDKLTRYIRDMCRFVNLSTTQARVIDVTFSIPYFDRSKQPVLLSTTRRLPIHDIRIGPVLPDRFDPFLCFPIRIEPNGVVEGRIEFDVPDGVDGDDLNLFAACATIKEARSHQSRRLGKNDVYDARKRRSYAGRIGEPLPIWGPRLKRWIKWATGNPLPKDKPLRELKAEAKALNLSSR